MKSSSRRTLMRTVGAALAAPTISRYAHAAEIKWRIGHVAPADSPLHRNLLDAAELISKRSDGRMELAVLGEGRAGVQSGLVAQVRTGGIEMTLATCTHLAPTLLFCSVPSVGFLFSDYAKLWPAMDGELGQMIRTQIRSQFGVEVMDKIWDFGFRAITTSPRPILTAADIAGLKIRTQVDTDQMEMFRALDAVPVVITLPYLRRALEHHQIDGQDGMLPVVEYARLNEVQSYCAMTRHVWDGLSVLVNVAAWKGLPERLQNVVSNAFNGAAMRQREDSKKMEDAARASLTKAGMKVNDVDNASFRDLLRRHGHYARVREKIGNSAWAIVQKTTGVTA